MILVEMTYMVKLVVPPAKISPKASVLKIEWLTG